MKNYIGQSLWLTVLLTVLLVAISVFSKETSLAGFNLRKFDLFSDVRPARVVSDPGALDSLLLDSLSMATPDTLVIADPGASDSLMQGPFPPVDSIYFGKIFEDYSFRQDGLNRFYAAIDSIGSHRHAVRVAFFGDSFVEGDILIGDLRDTLQSVWGGGGVGFVPITSEVAQFKRTIQHEYRGWNTFSIVKNSDSGQPFGINGFVYRPNPEAKIHYKGANYFRHTRSWSEVRLFYQTENDLMFVWQNAGMPPQEAVLAAKTGNINVWKWGQAGIQEFAIRFPQTDSLRVYGASLESGPGFYIDNFSVRGNTGGRLKLIKPAIARQFDAYQHYDLIVLQLGLNAATDNLRNIGWYRHELDLTFAHIRACFPDRPILIVGVPDRAGKIDGELVTLPSVPAITGMQRDLARKYGFLFFDLYHGMGGAGAMLRLANAKPMLANKDYTHLTHEGGKMMGHLFAELFLEEQARYNAKQNDASVQ